MNSKVNIILFFCVAFLPYFLQCQDDEPSSLRRRNNCEIKEEVISEESINDVTNIVAECEIKEKSEHVINIDEQKLAELHEVFKVYDMDEDNFISCDELRAIIEPLGFTGYSDESIRKMISRHAKNGIKVTFDEFVIMMTSNSESGGGQNDIANFTLIDENGDGVLTPEEMLSHLTTLHIDITLEGVKEAVSPYCKDKDNLNMDFEDFKKFLQDQ